MKLSKKIKRFATFKLLTFFLFFINFIPRSLSNFIGSFLGVLLWSFSKKEQHKIFRHLSIAFKDKFSDHEKNMIGKMFYINSGKNLMDVLRFNRHYRKDIAPFIEVEGMEFLMEAQNRGKGVFGVTGHIGNFELLAVYLQSVGIKVGVIGREMYDKKIDAILIKNRTAMGLTNFSTTDSPRKILEWLKSGNSIGVLIDNDSMRVRSVFVPFFGHMANTPVGQSFLGLKTGTAFVPMACVRTEHNTYKVVIRPEVRINKSEDADFDAYEITRLCSKEIEDLIYQYPQQWPWIHNRWQTNVNESLDK